MRYCLKINLLLCVLCLSLTGKAQKKALTIDDYREWKRVDRPELSEDGKWMLYQVTTTGNYALKENTAGLYLYNADTRKTLPLPQAEQAFFWGKGKWLCYTVKDTAVLAQDSVFLVNLRNMNKVYWDKKVAFDPIRNSEKICWTRTIESTPDDVAKKISDRTFNRLVVFDMAAGDSVYIDQIGYYTFYNHNQSIIYVKEEGQRQSLCFGRLKGPYHTLFTVTNGKIQGMRLGENESEGTFCVATDSLIYTFSLKESSCRLVFDRKDIPVPAGHRIRNLQLSENQKYVTYDLCPEKQIPQDKSLKRDTSFELELWTWNEDVPQSRQGRSGYRPRIGYPKYIYHLQDRRNLRLSSSSTDRIIKPTCRDYDYMIITDKSAYYSERDWKETLSFDAFLVNIRNGETRLIARGLTGNPVWSPNGKYAILYNADRKAWYQVVAATGELTDISSRIRFPVYDEGHDKPCAAAPYGIAGWSKDGNEVVIYDRYDMWVIDLTGKKKTYSFTDGYGRKNLKTIRLLRADYDPEVLNLEGENLVQTVDKITKDEGIYVLSPGGHMRKLIEGACKLQVLKKSGNGKYCVFNRQSYTDFRDLWWSKMDFARPVKVTDANPQQKEYNWGSAKLVKWTNYEGKPNEGLLYLPENYNPEKKYPVLVQFYETHTGELNVYHAPALSSAMADIPTFVSNGYIVFMPDVHFTIGNPGQSCYDAVVSGTQMLIDRGIADKDRIGLQGHSWSGFQTSYLVTKTDLFRCANIGAPIVDMVSGYVGIRNGSGLIRFFMYEDTQSRMGKSLWDDKDGYLRNSPLLEADKIHTPLLIFHCDADEAVAYEQGRSLYLAMRRLQKPAWLLNYKGDGHFLSNEAAQRDWTIRMQQFFDHYLKDAPMPRWMDEGININERGIDQKYDPVK